MCRLVDFHHQPRCKSKSVCERLQLVPVVIYASVFLICSNRAFCCSVRVALSFVSSRTTVTNDPPLSVPFAILCTVFSKNERLNAILIQHTGSLHRFFIFHNILFVNKQKQEKYICLKLHIEKSDCHPLS